LFSCCWWWWCCCEKIIWVVNFELMGLLQCDSERNHDLRCRTWILKWVSRLIEPFGICNNQQKEANIWF
jgi:hypothetical protein